MHPQVQSDEEGTCPICGMNLVEKTAESENEDHSMHHNMEEHSEATVSDHSAVKLSYSRQQMIGVRTEKVENRKLFKVVRAPARVAFDPELYTAQSEYLEALKQWSKVKNSPISAVKENTQQMIRSSKIRLKVLGLSDVQIKRLAKRGKQSEGLLVSGNGLENWVYADVFEVDLPYIKPGLSVDISANFLKGESLPAKVVSVDQVINSTTRTAKVRIQILDTTKKLRPESYVNVKIFAPMGEYISVSLDAILDTGRETIVFVKKGEKEFEPRKVNILFETEEYAAIKGGVEAGEIVVSSGNFMLDSESRLQSAIKGISSAHDMHK